MWIIWLIALVLLFILFPALFVIVYAAGVWMIHSPLILICIVVMAIGAYFQQRSQNDTR